jgi:hypothetical protein
MKKLILALELNWFLWVLWYNTKLFKYETSKIKRVIADQQE